MSYYKHRSLIITGLKEDLQKVSQEVTKLLEKHENTTPRMLSNIVEPVYCCTCAMFIGPNGSGYSDDADDLYESIIELCHKYELQYCWVAFGGDDNGEYFLPE